jgi:hypothetical protein
MGCALDPSGLGRIVLVCLIGHAGLRSTVSRNPRPGVRL